MAITLWSNFNHGPLVSNVYTHGATEYPSGHTYTDSGTSITIEAPGGGWGSQNLLDLGNNWAASASDTIAGTLIPSDACRILLLLEDIAGDQEDAFRLEATTVNNGLLVVDFTATDIRVTHTWNAGNSQLVWSVTEPTNPFALEIRVDHTEATFADRLQCRAWQLGQSVPSLTAAGATFGSTGTPDDFLTRILGASGNNSYYYYGKIIGDDDPDASLSGYESTENYPGGGGANPKGVLGGVVFGGPFGGPIG